MRLFSIFHAILKICMCAKFSSGSNPSAIELISHLLFLDNVDTLHNPRVNFELGLASQLLADADPASIADALSNDPSIGSIFSLDKQHLRNKSEESYRLYLNEVRLSNTIISVVHVVPGFDWRHYLTKSSRCLPLYGSLEHSRKNPNDADALSNLAQLLSNSNDALYLYERAVASNPYHLQLLLNYGITLRKVRRYNDACSILNHALHRHPHSNKLRLELAHNLEHLGEIEAAASIYRNIIHEDPANTDALLNLAATHHKVLAIDEAINGYSKALLSLATYERACFIQFRPAYDQTMWVPSPFPSLITTVGNFCTCPPKSDVNTVYKILSNNGQALHQLGRYTDAIDSFSEVLNLQRKCNPDWASSIDYMTTSVLLFLSAKAGCYFPAWGWLDSLVSTIDTSLDIDEAVPPMKPFDTLGLPVTPKWKKKVAEVYSDSFDTIRRGDYPYLDIERNHTSQRMKLAFMSHDFGDHPTTYLALGVLVAHKNSSTVDIAAYSYGPNDGSETRKYVEKVLEDSKDGGTFFDLYGMSHDGATQNICDDRPDIIFDMQGFTLGARPQLMAKKCAGIQANFLAFPGTSGSSFIDYIIVDHYVAAIEHAEEEFSEKLAILPRSYQANYFPEQIAIPFRGSMEWKKLRVEENLPTNSQVFVFANLNKSDKIDPYSFSVWLECMQQIPQSVLWLLEPSQTSAAEFVKKNLLSASNEAGISSDRIIFAKKVHRTRHIRRMAAGDLFLDSFYYGAHTTATDAMRGGMPLLTLAGDSFSNRVGMSLLHSMNSKRAASLIAHSRQEYVEVAVEIATAQIAYASTNLPYVQALGSRFVQRDKYTKNDLFNWKEYSNDLDHLSRMMIEVKGNMHVVLTK